MRMNVLWNLHHIHYKILTLQTVKDAVMNQFVSDIMEVSIVGDFSEEEIESCVMDYLGTVRATKGAERALSYNPVVFRPSPNDLHFQQVFLKDTDERACAYIVGPAPNIWGYTVDGTDLLESISNVSGNNVGLLAEIINSRLSTEVRDSQGLTYDVSFELNLLLEVYLFYA